MSMHLERLDALGSWVAQRTGDNTSRQTWWVTVRFDDGTKLRRGSRASFDDAIARAEQACAERVNAGKRETSDV